MITNIKMLGIASYKNMSELNTDKKVNIIYGLNGTGKSTISNFLYDQSDDSYQQCNASVSEDEKVLVYNQKFIQDYFYEADSLKGVFSLSKENKEIEEKLKAAETKLAELTNNSSQVENRIKDEEDKLRKEKEKSAEITWKIKAQYTGGDRVLEFFLVGLKGNKEVLFNSISSLEKPKIEPKRNIAAIKKDVESLSGDSAKSYEQLPLIDFNQQDNESNEIFNFVIVGNEDSVVSGLIKQLNNSDWVREGLDYMVIPKNGDSTQCPFCQEKNITNVLAENIRGYFDKSFEDSLNQISSILEQYQTAAAQLTSADSLDSNPFAKEKLPELKLRYQTFEKLISNNILQIQNKKATPSIQVQLETTSAAVEEVNEILKTINHDITRHNERISNIENELSQLKSEFWSLMRWDYDQTISNWYNIDEESKLSIDNKTAEKDIYTKNISDTRLEIQGLQKSTVNIEGAIENINNGLIHLGITDFSIKKYSDDLYRIHRSEKFEAEFTSLSEGEKMIISFLYFCEICKGKQSADEEASKKIVVVDDPISSLSHIFVYNIAQFLKTDFFSSPLYEQVFVLTHSLYFFYELADSNHKRRSETQKLFRLTKNTDGSSIREMKYEEVQNDYQSYWVIVTDENQHPALIANCMRNIIEYFFNFIEKADFSNVIQKPELQENRYQAFCRYMNRESHSLGQNIFDYKEFNYDDFREGLRLIFQVTGYSEHYEKMTKALKI